MPGRTQASPIPWAVIPLFRNLTAEQREHLRPMATIRAVEPGEELFREGDAATRFHFILGGRLKIVKAAPDGKEIILEILGPGDPAGAVAVLEDRALPAGAVAIEATSVLSLPASGFFDLMEANPRLVRGLLLGLTRRLMELTRRLADRSARAEVRVARLFLTLGDRMGRQDGAGFSLPLTLSRQEIADLVGITQETAIRILSRWSKERILITEPTGFRIVDRTRLADLAPEE